MILTTTVLAILALSSTAFAAPGLPPADTEVHLIDGSFKASPAHRTQGLQIRPPAVAAVSASGIEGRQSVNLCGDIVPAPAVPAWKKDCTDLLYQLRNDPKSLFLPNVTQGTCHSWAVRSCHLSFCARLGDQSLSYGYAYDYLDRMERFCFELDPPREGHTYDCYNLKSSCSRWSFNLEHD